MREFKNVSIGDAAIFWGLNWEIEPEDPVMGNEKQQLAGIMAVVLAFQIRRGKTTRDGSNIGCFSDRPIDNGAFFLKWKMPSLLTEQTASRQEQCEQYLRGFSMK